MKFVKSIMMYQTLVCLCVINVQTNAVPLHCTQRAEEHQIHVKCINPSEFPRDLPPKTTHLSLVCHGMSKEPNLLLSFSRLSYIPSNALTQLNLTVFETIGCPIKYFGSAVFNNLKLLKKITIEQSLLRGLDGDMLMDTNGLSELRLIDCPHLSYLDPILLAGQSQLKRVEFSGLRLNGAILLPVLHHVRHSLRYLRFSRNLIPIDVAEDLFVGFRLNSLDLSYNQISDLRFLVYTNANKLSLRGIQSLPKPFQMKNYPRLAEQLMTLDLRQTRLYGQLNATEVELSEPQDDMYLTRMPRLENLLLGHNSLEGLAPDFLERLPYWLPSLQTLDLQFNQLTSLPTELQRSPQVANQLAEIRLQLEGNPFHCNCELSWLLRGSEANPNQYDAIAEQITCATLASERIAEIDLHATLRAQVADLKLIRWEQDTKGAMDLACIKPTPPRLTVNRKGQLENRSNRIQEEQDSYRTEVTPGETLQIECRSSGDPPPTLMWQAETVSDTAEPIMIKTTHRRGPKAPIIAVHLNIEIQSTTPSIMSWTCKAINQAGEAQSRLVVINPIGGRSQEAYTSTKSTYELKIKTVTPSRTNALTNVFELTHNTIGYKTDSISHRNSVAHWHYSLKIGVLFSLISLRIIILLRELQEFSPC